MRPPLGRLQDCLAASCAEVLTVRSPLDTQPMAGLSHVCTGPRNPSPKLFS